MKNFCIILLIVFICANLNAQTPEEYCFLSYENIYRESLTRPILSGTELTLETDNFVIHYTLSGSDATNLNYVQVVSEAAEYSWDVQVNQLGWREPPADDNRGGNNKYDIYIRYRDGGTCIPEVTPGWSKEWAPSYIEITNEYTDSNKLRSVITHEFNHACQFSFTYRDIEILGTWFYENSAVWMEYIVYPEFENYLIWLAGPTPPENPITNPSRGINHSQGSYMYGGFLWPLFLSEWTLNSDIVRRIWERIGDSPGNQIFSDINGILEDDHNTETNFLHLQERCL